MSRNKDHVKFSYDDPEFMPRLLPQIAENANEVTIVLRPNVPELLKATYHGSHNSYDPTKYTFQNSYFAELAQAMKKLPKERRGRPESFRQQLTVLATLDICETHSIRPYTQLHCQESHYPKLRYVDPDESYGGNELIREICRDPALLVTRDEWESIYFERQSGEQLAKSKIAIDKFLEHDYVITHISAGLNPHWRGSHYDEHIEHDVYLSIDVKEIFFSAEMDDDFKENPSLDALMQRFLITQ